MVRSASWYVSSAHRSRRKGPDMYFDPKEFGKRMKEARNRKGLTQERLAEILGVDRLHVNRLEKGAKACSVDLLIDISQLLDVSTDYLLKGTPVISSDARVRMLSALTELTAIINEL